MLNSLSIQELLELKREILLVLDDIDDEIILFPLDQQDIEYLQLINKAVYYRTMIEKIDSILKQTKP